MSSKEFNVTAVAGGHSVEEDKQTLHAGRARASYSALKLRSSTLWTAFFFLAFSVLRRFSAQMNSGLSGHTGAFYSHLEKQGHGQTRDLAGRSAGRTITNERSVKEKKKNTKK